MTITVKRSPADDTCFSHFTGVEIDGTTLVNGTDYTAVSGSTVVTLKADTLQRLSTGGHTVTMHFDDGRASTGLTVKAAPGGGSGGGGGNSGGGSSSGGNSGGGSSSSGKSPKTGDESNLALWSGLMLLSLAGGVGTGVTARRRRKES